MLNQLLDDLRFPIGLLFSIFSVILIVVGLIKPQTAAAGIDINLNVSAGVFMGVFGLFMALSAVWSARGKAK
ncbi:MAG: hypothetical protein WCK75_08325 [Elusimicrobiota bacterium]